MLNACAWPVDWIVLTAERPSASASASHPRTGSASAASGAANCDTTGVRSPAGWRSHPSPNASSVAGTSA